MPDTAIEPWAAADVTQALAAHTGIRAINLGFMKLVSGMVVENPDVAEWILLRELRNRHGLIRCRHQSLRRVALRPFISPNRS